MRERGVRDKSKVWAIGRMVGPSVVMGKAIGRASLKGKRSAILGNWSLRSLLDIHLEMLSRKLDMWFWSLEERSELEIEIWESLVHRWYLKP